MKHLRFIFESREDIIRNAKLDNKFSTFSDERLDDITEEDIDDLNNILDIFTELSDKYLLTNTTYDGYIGRGPDRYQVNFSKGYRGNFLVPCKTLNFDIYYNSSNDINDKNLRSKLRDFNFDVELFVDRLKAVGYNINKFKNSKYEQYSYIQIILSDMRYIKNFENHYYTPADPYYNNELNDILSEVKEIFQEYIDEYGMESYDEDANFHRRNGLFYKLEKDPKWSFISFGLWNVVTAPSDYENNNAKNRYKMFIDNDYNHFIERLTEVGYKVQIADPDNGTGIGMDIYEIS